MSGEGSVYRRKSDGRWCASLSIGPRGSSRKFVRYAPRDDNTRTAARRLLAELVAGARVTTDRTTLGEYLQRWLDDYDAGPSQRANAESLVRLWIAPAIGGEALRSLRPDDVRLVLSAVRRTRSAQLARHVYNVLAVALDQAEGDGIIARNPVRQVKRPAVAVAEKRPWNREQVRSFLDASADDRYHALYVTAAATGLRQGELLGLTWADVDLERGQLVIAVQLQRVAGEYRRVPPKGNRPPRIAHVPALAVDALRKHRADQLAERVKAGQPTEDGLVFVTERGRPVNASVVTHRLQRIADGAGLPRQDFHSLRRFRASLDSELGTPVKVAQAALGHADASTTLRHYTYATDAQAKLAAELVDAALRSA